MSTAWNNPIEFKGADGQARRFVRARNPVYTNRNVDVFKWALVRESLWFIFMRVENYEHDWVMSYDGPINALVEETKHQIDHSFYEITAKQQTAAMCAYIDLLFPQLDEAPARVTYKVDAIKMSNMFCGRPSCDPDVTALAFYKDMYEKNETDFIAARTAETERMGVALATGKANVAAHAVASDAADMARCIAIAQPRPDDGALAKRIVADIAIMQRASRITARENRQGEADTLLAIGDNMKPNNDAIATYIAQKVAMEQAYARSALEAMTQQLTTARNAQRETMA